MDLSALTSHGATCPVNLGPDCQFGARCTPPRLNGLQSDAEDQANSPPRLDPRSAMPASMQYVVSQMRCARQQDHDLRSTQHKRKRETQPGERTAEVTKEPRAKRKRVLGTRERWLRRRLVKNTTDHRNAAMTKSSVSTTGQISAWCRPRLLTMSEQLEVPRAFQAMGDLQQRIVTGIIQRFSPQHHDLQDGGVVYFQQLPMRVQVKIFDFVRSTESKRASSGSRSVEGAKQRPLNPSFKWMDESQLRSNTRAAERSPKGKERRRLPTTVPAPVQTTVDHLLRSLPDLPRNQTCSSDENPMTFATRQRERQRELFSKMQTDFCMLLAVVERSEGALTLGHVAINSQPIPVSAQSVATSDESRSLTPAEYEEINRVVDTLTAEHASTIDRIGAESRGMSLEAWCSEPGAFDESPPRTQQLILDYVRNLAILGEL